MLRYYFHLARYYFLNATHFLSPTFLFSLSICEEIYKLWTLIKVIFKVFRVLSGSYQFGFSFLHFLVAFVCASFFLGWWLRSIFAFKHWNFNFLSHMQLALAALRRASSYNKFIHFERFEYHQSLSCYAPSHWPFLIW